METKLTEIKALAAVVISALGAFLGWKGVLFVVWFAVLILDWLSGSWAARKAGEWTSEKSREGRWHKVSEALVIAVAGIVDVLLTVALTNVPVIDLTYSGWIFPLVLVWYIITELGSILENAIKMGAPVPSWLAKGLKAGLAAIDKAGEQAIPEKEGKGHDEGG